LMGQGLSKPVLEANARSREKVWQTEAQGFTTTLRNTPTLKSSGVYSLYLFVSLNVLEHSSSSFYTSDLSLSFFSFCSFSQETRSLNLIIPFFLLSLCLLCKNVLISICVYNVFWCCCFFLFWKNSFTLAFSLINMDSST
jgi:hypothetical protein